MNILWNIFIKDAVRFEENPAFTPSYGWRRAVLHRTKKHTLVGAFNRCSGLELFLEDFRISGNRREKPQIKIGLDVDGSPIGTI